MPTKKHNRSTPGTIFSPGNCNTLYYKLFGKKYSTGMKDTPANRKMLGKIVEQKYLEQKGLIEPTPEAVTIQKAFAEYLEVKTDLEKSTLDRYDLSFRWIIGDQDFVITVARIRACVMEFRKRASVEANTQINYLRDFQVFINWCSEEEQAYLKPVNFRKFGPKAELAAPPATYTPDEVRTIIEYWWESDREFALFISFIAMTGWRYGQVARLNWENIKDDYIWIVAKNRKRRQHFPLTQGLRRVLDELKKIDMTRRRKTPAEKLFRWGPVTHSRTLQYLREAMRQMEIPVRGRGWHSFRDTFGTYWASQGLAVTDLNQLTGHVDIQTTKDHYIVPDLRRIGERIEETPFLEIVQKSSPT